MLPAGSIDSELIVIINKIFYCCIYLTVSIIIICNLCESGAGFLDVFCVHANFKVILNSKLLLRVLKRPYRLTIIKINPLTLK